MFDELGSEARKEMQMTTSRKPAVVTGPHPGGGWQNKVEGNQRASNISSTKAEAQAKGRQMAIGLKTEHKIQNKEGRITERNSYGRDPFPPRG
jgi:Uncharacterized protein conserved in bacteria (DUF2188)